MSELEDLKKENARLRKKLEIDFVYGMDLKEIPATVNLPDGIDCRDATIAELEEQIKKLKKTVDF